MDILQARKRAQDEKEKEAAAKTQPEEAAPRVEERAVSPAPSPYPEIATEPAGEKPRKKKTKAARKPAPATMVTEVSLDRPSESATQPASIMNTRLDDIPIGAKAPEEIELQPHEFHGLPGTQDMPELPEMSEEELSGNIGLGDVPRQNEDISLTHSKNVEKEIEDEGPVDFPEEPPPTPAAKYVPPKSPPRTKPEPEADAPTLVPEEPEDDNDHWNTLDSGDGETDKVSVEDTPLEFLSFMLGEEEYGIPLQRISEIIKPRVITEVPRVSPFVLGILTLRGVVIPVFDLAKRLSLGNVALCKLSRIIIVYRGEDKVGLLVDRVRDVVRVLPQDIEPPPPVIAGVDMQFLDGVGRAEGADGARGTFGGSSARIGANGTGVQALVEEGLKSNEKIAVKRRRLVILLNLERVASL